LIKVYDKVSSRVLNIILLVNALSTSLHFKLWYVIGSGDSCQFM
jgi:hypothetical protein